MRSAVLLVVCLIFVQCTDCPGNFTYLSSVNGGCYKVVTRNLNWNAAGLNCHAIHKDAHLLVINDAAEQSAVAGMLTSISSLYQIFFFALYKSTTTP